jgi:hypothetical protein
VSNAITDARSVTIMMSPAAPGSRGALALELAPGTHAGNAALDAAVAATLAGHIAHDLAALAPDAVALDLGVLAVHFDPVELLRPGWPLHAALAELIARAPVARLPLPQAGEGWGEGRVFAFGSHDGRLPDAMQPPAGEYARGPLRLIPFLLRGDTEVAARVGDTLEESLLDRGMAGAATALFAQQAFDARIEHARYLTLHDLCALMAMQYEHAGLAPLWPLLECALLAPAEEAWLDAPPEPLARYADGGVRMAMFDIDTWRDAGFAPEGIDSGHLPRIFDHFAARQRQFAAVLAAHEVPVTFDYCAAGKDPRKILVQ